MPSNPPPRSDDEEAAHQARIAEACVGLGAKPEGRLGLYRTLIQRNLAAVARRLLPRAAAALDATGADAFDTWFARFLAEKGPRTSYLRDVPTEFVDWGVPEWTKDPSLPPFITDLARYEVTLFEVESAPRSAPSSTVDVSLEAPLAFATPNVFRRFDHDVLADAESPSSGETFVLFHRDEDNAVHTTRVESAWGALVPLLLGGAPLGEAIARTPGADPTRVAALLAALGETGALLGGRAP